MKNSHVSPRDLDALTITIGPAETAERLGMKKGTLDNLRWRGGGPRYVKCGGRVRYRLIDIADYLDQRTRTSTSDARA
jgi:predicted DNA-binding transcriptional regulator AlpA